MWFYSRNIPFEKFVVAECELIVLFCMHNILRLKGDCILHSSKNHFVAFVIFDTRARVTSRNLA